MLTHWIKALWSLNQFDFSLCPILLHLFPFESVVLLVDNIYPKLSISAAAKKPTCDNNKSRLKPGKFLNICFHDILLAQVALEKQFLTHYVTASHLPSKDRLTLGLMTKVLMQ